MKIKDYRNHFLNQLTPQYDTMEAERFFALTLEELKGWRRADLAMNPNAVLTEAELQKWSSVLADLKNDKPIQYIFGKTWFYGLEFKVNENTLIPRPETEELVEWIVSENKNRQRVKILDIGTGTGCIAISIAKNIPGAQVFAVDVSPEALAVAKTNAQTNAAGVTFWQKNILEAESLPEQFDIIVSNPPYVRNLEKQEIKDNVLQYEPHLALFVEDNDPLLFYRKIALLGQQSLKPGGKLFFEINQYLAPETLQMLENYNYKEVELRKDLFGNDRMIKAAV